MTESVDFLFDGPERSERIVVLAHGAGAAMDTPFMDAFAEGLGARGLRVARFEFPFMRLRRQFGSRKPPDRAPVLLDCWREVIAKLAPAGRLVIGGKSMGGRMASLIADQAAVAGLVCLGYPFHPAGKPEKTRTEHLETLRTATLILQGERDTLGTRADVDGYVLSSAIRVHWLADGDHSFKPRKASGRGEARNWDEGIAAVADFCDSL